MRQSLIKFYVAQRMKEDDKTALGVDKKITVSFLRLQETLKESPLNNKCIYITYFGDHSSYFSRDHLTELSPECRSLTVPRLLH